MARRPRVNYAITATDATARGVRSAERGLGRLRQQFSTVRGAAQGAGIGFGAVTAEITRLGEGSIQTANRIKIATDSVEEQQLVLAALRAQSQDTGLAIESSIDAFAGLDRVQEDIGLTTANMLTLTEVIQKSGVISGRTNTDIQLGIRGISQALAQNVVRTEEYNQILDNVPDLINRLVDSLDGVESGGQLRQLVLDGELLSSTLAVGLLDATEAVREDFDQLDLTAGRAFDGLVQGYQSAIDNSDLLKAANQQVAVVLRGLTELLFGPSTNEGRIQAIEAEIALTERLIGLNEAALSRGEGQNALQRLLGTDSISNLERHNAELDELNAELTKLRGLTNDGTETEGILNAGAANRALQEFQDLADEITKIGERRDAEAQKARERAAAQRVVDIRSRLDDNREMSARLREEALRSSGDLLQIERDRFAQTSQIIDANEAQARLDGNAVEQAQLFAQQRIDAENIKNARIAEINRQAAERERNASADAHQLELETLNIEFEERLAQELGFENRRAQELIQLEKDLQIALFAERTRGNDIAQRAAQITADFQIRLERNKVSAISGLVTDLSGVLATQSKLAFKVNKVAGIANAVVNTSVGVTKALELPWPLNLVAAASVAAVGAAQIATIKSATFGGGGGGSSGSVGSVGGSGQVQQAQLPEIPEFTAEDRNAQTLRIVVDAESGGLSQAIGESLRTEVDERGLIVVGPESAQAEAIRTGTTG